MAAGFVSPKFPVIDPLIAKVIGLHDAGWATFDSERDLTAPPMLRENRPVAFFEIEPAVFLCAWTASIDRAEQVSAAGGILVSRHFTWLADFRLRNASDSDDVRQSILAFLNDESKRQQRLLVDAKFPPQQLDALLRVLQFCDLLSLYLCCGSTERVEFPQEFSGERVCITPEDGAFVLTPSPFEPAAGKPNLGLSVAVEARRYPAEPGLENTRPVPFLLI